jgi:hypothetical protein
MTLAARTHPLSMVVHAVEAPGALCGARPFSGRWRSTMRLPINCPKCLYELSRPRLAICETPGPLGGREHIRRVGPEGIVSGRNRAAGLTTICGVIVGWDRKVFRDDDVKNPNVCPVCRKGVKDERRAS